MTISVTCECGRTHRFRDEHAGARYKCSQCGRTGRIPGQAASPAPSPESACLRVMYPGRFFLWDAKVALFLDGQQVGTGQVKKGIDLRIPTAVGSHVLEVTLYNKRTTFSLDLPAPGDYEAHLSYSRMAGNFSDKLDLRSPAPAAAASGPPAQGVAAVCGPVGPSSRVQAETAGFFPCLIVNTGRLGIEGLVPLHATLAGPSMRKGGVRLLSGQVSISCQDMHGASHELVSFPLRSIARVEARPWKERGAYLGRVLGRTAAAGAGIALLITLAVVSQQGYGYLGLTLGVSLVVGLMIASLFILLPGLLRAAKRRVSVVFRGVDERSYGVLIAPDQLEQVRDTLGRAGLPADFHT